MKLRCDKIKANLSLVRKYLNQSNEILLGTIPVLDADRADVVEKFSARYFDISFDYFLFSLC